MDASVIEVPSHNARVLLDRSSVDHTSYGTHHRLDLSDVQNVSRRG
jgi:hypothetical protein